MLVYVYFDNNKNNINYWKFLFLFLNYISYIWI